MGSEIYIANAQNVPKALKSDLREARSMHQSLYGDIGEDEECLVYLLGVRSVTNPFISKIPKEIVASVIESLTPRYTIFMKSREAFEQLDNLTPVYVLGSPPHFENVGELKADIRQAEEKGYRIVYETEADSIERVLQSMAKTR